MTKHWSDYQKRIFDFVENGTGNAIVTAVAGSGKSTTIVEAMKKIPPGKSSVFLAFNKSIAEELKARGVNAKTFHSLTFHPVLREKQAKAVDTNKLRKLMDVNFSGAQRNLYSTFACRLVGLAKQIGIGCLQPDSTPVWQSLVDHHDLELDSADADLNAAILVARALLDHSNASNMVDFDDMLYLSVRDGIELPKFDFVFVDEAQDTNDIQRAILHKILKPGGRLVAVGDASQAIYGFRGSSSDSLNLIKVDFNCVDLPLTVTYRCPTEVVKYAQHWVSAIEAAPKAKAGSVEHLGFLWEPTMFKARNLVICRTTRPLLSLAYRMMREGLPVRILGREIGEGMVKLIKKMSGTDLDSMLAALAKWETRETEKSIAKQDDARAVRIGDQAGAVRCIADGLPEDRRTIENLVATIESLFGSPADAVTLCTIHKSKGLEADSVFWLNSDQCPSKWARQPWQIQQERNLCYVAVTRARERLVTIQEANV